MSRVRYLAALGGTAGRRAPAPLLRPPRRLFPHEPPPLEAVPQPVENMPSPEQPVVRAKPTAPAALEPVEAVQPLRAPRPDTPPAPRAPRVEQVLEPPGEDAPPPPRERVPVLQAPSPSEEARTASRAPDPAPLARRDARRKPASLELEPARTAVARRARTPLEPSRLQPPAAVSPERAVATSRPAATAAHVPGLHIGSIDVVVTPPPAPREPVFAAPPPPVHQAPAPFAARSASTSRWFGLAQR